MMMMMMMMMMTTTTSNSSQWTHVPQTCYYCSLRMLGHITEQLLGHSRLSLAVVCHRPKFPLFKLQIFVTAKCTQSESVNSLKFPLSKL